MNKKRLITAWILGILLFNTFLVLGDTLEKRPDPNLIGAVVTAYEDGTYRELDQWAEISREGQGVATGILFEGWNISRYDTINEANLTLWYSNGFDWGPGTRNIEITALLDSGEELTWDLVYNGATTSSSVTYNISLWNSSGYYTIDIASVVQELVNRASWDPLDNITVRTFSDGSGESSPYPGYDYSYWYQSNRGAESNRRPTLSIDFSSEGEYKGWTITPGSGGAGDVWGVFQNSSSGREFWNFTGGATPGRTIAMEDVLGNQYGNCFELVGEDQYFLGINVSDVTVLNWYQSSDKFLTFDDVIEIYDYSSTMDYYTMIYQESTETFHIFYGISAGLYYVNVTYTGGVWTKGSNIQVQSNAGVNYLTALLDEDTGYIYCGFDRGNDARITRAMTPITGGAGAFTTGNIYSGISDGAPYLGISEAGEVFATVSYTSNSRIWLFKWNQSMAFGSVGSWISWGQQNQYDRMYGGGMDPDTADYNESFVMFGEDTVDGRHVPVVVYWNPEIANNNVIHKLNSTGTYSLYGAVHINYADVNDTQRCVYLINNYATVDFPEWFIRDDSKLVDPFGPSWDDYAMIGYTPLWYPRTIQKKQAGSSGPTNPVYTPPPGGSSSCVDNYLATHYPGGYNITNVQEAIDHCNEETSDPDDPTGGGFTGEEPWYLDRNRTKLYLIILGLSTIITPWVYSAKTGEASHMVIAIYLSIFGAMLLLGASMV